jgi:hypothetical protein
MALGLVVISGAGGGALVYSNWHSPEAAQEPPASSATAPSAPPVAAPTPSRGPRLFYGWPADRKPDLVLLLTGQVYGYMQPCGCSDPQYGGLERRYNFIQTVLQARGWPVLPLDLGDIAQHISPQALMKYRYTMEAMKRMGYAAAGIGLNETSLPLIDALGEYALNNPCPRVVSANLLDVDAKYPGMVTKFEVVNRPGMPTVAAVGVMSTETGRQVKDPDAKFGPAVEALKTVLSLPEVNKAEIRVLLFEGPIEEAKAYAQSLPQFQVILSDSREEEPPSRPTEIKADNVVKNLIVQVGHKGRDIGLVGFFRTGDAANPFKMYYELAQLGPEYKTPEGQDATNPMLALLERYSKEVKSRNKLAEYPKVPHPIQQQFPKSSYVGSAKCKSCHRESYSVWLASPHSHAYATLEKATRPCLRQYDGECVKCHVTGFDYQSGFRDEVSTPKLKDNGCENCHGPCSEHVQNQFNQALYPLMNPYKTQANETPAQKSLREKRLNDSCMKCHDTDNDVHWDLAKWVTGKIVHSEK